MLTCIAVPVSLDRTRALRSRCLDDYLRRRLHGLPNVPHQELSSPSPLRGDQTSPEVQFCDQSKARPHTSHGSSPAVARAASNPLMALPPRLETRRPSDSRLGHRHFTNEAQPISEDESPTPGPSDTRAGWNRRPSHGALLEVPDAQAVDAKLNVGSDNEATVRNRKGHDRAIFRDIENDVSDCFTGCAPLNSSFFTVRPSLLKTTSEGSQSAKSSVIRGTARDGPDAQLSELDAKTLLLGDFAENGSWWTGSRGNSKTRRRERSRERSPDTRKGLITSRSPRINWSELAEWYRLIIHVGESWQDRWRKMRPEATNEESTALLEQWKRISAVELEKEIMDARFHVQRSLLKATENLLKRPRRPLKHPEDCRFLLILLANPLLSASTPASSEISPSNRLNRTPSAQHSALDKKSSPSRQFRPIQTSGRTNGPGHHAGIIKRIVGLLANLPNEIHQCLVSWFSRFTDGHFQAMVDLVGSFVTHRLNRQHARARSITANPTDGLVPSFSSVPATQSSAQLHAALGVRPSNSSKKNDKKPSPTQYGEDWQIKAAARVMALLFAANSGHTAKKRDLVPPEQRIQSAGLSAKHAAHAHGQILPISNFYSTMLDYSDLVADFELWESNRGKFSFCQYPFFLSIWAKIHIMEHDARRQMEVKAREAFFDSILSRKAVSQYLVLKVRRDCLVEDSLRSVSEVIGSGVEEIKKGLRIDFVGEEGVDAGGLRKEWFLLLVREIFDPHHGKSPSFGLWQAPLMHPGLFVYDEDSHFCYFNPFCFESSEQFFLVGVLLGLAIYNSTILDVALPPFAFKKMLASAPTNSVPSIQSPRLSHTYTLEDLAEFRPALARGLRGLLDFDGDVQSTFCRDFVAEVDRYGEVIEIPLCPEGERKPVTNANRHEFVDLYVQYLLDVQVARQFEPFKRGFFTVCGGNALSLFRPEEIELLVRGSDEPLDIASLRAVAAYEGWGTPRPEELEPVIGWFWDVFEKASPSNQRRILSFITGSDRIPAMGATNLIIKVVCAGDGDSQRLPTARTCFNMVALWRYGTKAKLEQKLWMAVGESEGFGLK